MEVPPILFREKGNQTAALPQSSGQGGETEEPGPTAQTKKGEDKRLTGGGEKLMPDRTRQSKKEKKPKEKGKKKHFRSLSVVWIR